MSYRGDIGEVSVTGREAGRESLEWVIPGFLSLDAARGDDYGSPYFNACGGEWRLRIYPNGMSEWKSGYCDLVLGRWDAVPVQTFTLTAGIRGMERRRRIVTTEISPQNRRCCWFDICHSSDLKDADSLVITLDVMIHEPRDSSTQTDEELRAADVLRELTQAIRDRELYAEEIKSLKEQNKSLIGKCEEQTRIITETSSELKKAYADFELYEKEVESLMEQNKDLNRKCEEQTQIICEATSELKKARMDNECQKNERQSLMEQIKSLEMTVEKYRTSSDKGIKQTDPFESEHIVSAENYEGQAAFDDAETENINDENNEESKVEKNVLQPSGVKKTKKISLPTRHGGVISSLKSILKDKIRADFTLKSGSSEWPVHRAILESRSSHFQALLQGAQKEEVRIGDVREDEMEVVLRFLYAGEAEDLTPENVRVVHAAAHELNLVGLESLCVECMKEWMCPELVCIALIVAKKFREGDLKERALQCYFRESVRVVDTEGWKELRENHPDIIRELFEELIKRMGKNRRKEQE